MAPKAPKKAPRKTAKTDGSLRVELVPIDSLIPDPANTRSHAKRNLAAVKASLQRFGQRKPIVVGEDGTVQAGNATLEAAKALGWEKIAVVRSPLKGVDAVAYGIADNRTAELASWDRDALGAALGTAFLHPGPEAGDQTLDGLLDGRVAEVQHTESGDLESLDEDRHRRGRPAESVNDDDGLGVGVGRRRQAPGDERRDS